MRVLLVEDDRSLASGIKTALTRAAHAVDHVDNGAEALRFARDTPIDMVVLDLGLPGMDGLSVLRELRAAGSAVPVLILTARDALNDKLSGLDGGADDYLTKPFAVEELLARIRVLGRRGNELQDNELSLGPVQINLARHAVSLRGEPVKLSRREFALLRALADRPGQVFSREQLEEKLYTWDDDVSSNTIDVYIHNLRKKLGTGLIKNIRGVGYVLEPGA